MSCNTARSESFHVKRRRAESVPLTRPAIKFLSTTNVGKRNAASMRATCLFGNACQTSRNVGRKNTNSLANTARIRENYSTKNKRKQKKSLQKNKKKFNIQLPGWTLTSCTAVRQHKHTSPTASCWLHRRRQWTNTSAACAGSCSTLQFLLLNFTD